jgi:protoporphyrinogen IX oxidase
VSCQRRLASSQKGRHQFMLLLKAFHLIAMVAWFAGLFYLPRLFVYHADSTDKISLDRFKIMERRLYYGIMAPAAIATIGLGLWLLSYNFSGYLQMGWMLAKLILVGILIIFHVYCGMLRKQFAADQNQHSSKFYRMLNEFPTLILISVVLLAVVKPIL